MSSPDQSINLVSRFFNWAQREGTLAMVGVVILGYQIFVVRPDQVRAREYDREQLQIQLETARTTERSVAEIKRAVDEIKSLSYQLSRMSSHN